MIQDTNELIIHLNWAEFATACGELASCITHDGFKPDIIVALARGGWIPGRFLSDMLGVKQITSFGLHYTDSDRTNLETYSLPSLSDDFSNILLVEDMIESGASLQKAKQVLGTPNRIIKTAALYYRKDSQIRLDYTLGLKEKVIFPWEIS